MIIHHNQNPNPNRNQNLTNIKTIFSTYGAFAALDNSGTVHAWGNAGGNTTNLTNGNIKTISQGEMYKRGHYIYHPEYDKLYYNDEYSNLYNPLI